MEWEYCGIFAAREILSDKGFLIDMETLREALTAAVVAQELDFESIKKSKDLAYEFGYRDALSKIQQALCDVKEKSNERLAAHKNSGKKQPSDPWTL
jgi:hypothetical protein